MMIEKKTLSAIALLGPTAIGKTSLAIQIAQRFHCEIIGVDSMQIYRHMDIGTAKPTAAERAQVPHHLVDMIDPADEYTVARFIGDALKAVDDIRSKGHIPLFVGGTGLYLKGLVEGIFEEFTSLETVEKQEVIRGKLRCRLEQEGRLVLYDELKRCDPVSAQRIHPNDTHRLLRGLEIFELTGKPWSEHLERQQQVPSPPFAGRILKLAFQEDRDLLYDRINHRVDLMIREGLLDEVKWLLENGYGAELKSMQSIGYRHMVEYLAGERGKDETINLLARDTRRYAKRQFTWFRKDADIQWFTTDQFEEMAISIQEFLTERDTCEST